MPKQTASFSAEYSAIAKDIVEQPLVDEMAASYCAYAMAVNLGRAIPQVLDGLKPTQRKALFIMAEMALWHDKPHRKVARISGEIAKVYVNGSPDGSLVGLAMPHANRYLAIDGQGNYGSVSDGPAASRYIEARLSLLGQELFASNLYEGTVDWQPNYDGTCQEPVLLPARLPFLLLRDTSGMGVAAACSHVSYNAAEVCALAKAALQGKLLNDTDYVSYVTGPDLASGGLIVASEGMHAAMATGRGSFHVQANLVIEDGAFGRDIVALDLPQDVSPERVLDQTKQAIVDEHLPKNWIREVRDETDRDGTRVVWELSRLARPEAVIALLLKHTSCRICISVAANAVAPNGKSIQQYGICAVANEWASFRRSSELSHQKYLLGKLSHKHELANGLLLAVRNIDLVVRAMQSNQELSEVLDLTDAQAEAIEAMPLRSLRSANVAKIEAQLDELSGSIAAASLLVNSSAELTKYLVRDVAKLAKQFGDERRSGFVGVQQAALASAGAQQLQELRSAAPQQHGGWLIDCGDGLYYRHTKATHDKFATVDTALNLRILAIFSNGFLYSIPADAVALGGKTETSVRKLIADYCRSPLDSTDKLLWSSIAQAKPTSALVLQLFGNHAAKTQGACKLIGIGDVSWVARKPKWLGMKLVAALPLGLATVQYAGGDKITLDLEAELAVDKWHTVGNAMRNEALVKAELSGGGKPAGGKPAGWRRS